MNKFRIAAITCFVLFAFSFTLFAAIEKQFINAPLDGGLLTILGVAGIAYFIIRKKRK